MSTAKGERRSSHDAWTNVLQHEATLYFVADGLQRAREAASRGESVPLEAAKKAFSAQQRQLIQARRHYRLRYMLPVAVVGWTVLASCGLVAWLAFRAVGTDYLQWFINNGDVVALIFGTAVLAIDLERHPELISAHPLKVVMVTFAIAAEAFESWSAVIGRRMTDRELEGTTSSVVQTRYRSRTLDVVISSVFMWSAVASIFAWFVFIAPLQYVCNLVVGAPGRAALASRQTFWVLYAPSSSDFGFWKRSDGQVTRTYYRWDKSEQPAEGALEISVAKHPVALSAGLLAASLWAISTLFYA